MENRIENDMSGYILLKNIMDQHKDVTMRSADSNRDQRIPVEDSFLHYDRP